MRYTSLTVHPYYPLEIKLLTPVGMLIPIVGHMV